VSAACARERFQREEFSNLANIDDATFCFSGHDSSEKRNAHHFVPLDGLSARASSRWTPRARESHETVDGARASLDGDEHGDPTLRGQHHAQDTCV